MNEMKQEYEEISTRNTYAYFQPMNLKKFVCIENKFVNNRLRLNRKRQLPMPGTAKEDNTTNGLK